MRKGNKVRKLRLYLGVGLSKKELETKKKHAEEVLKEKIKKYSVINNPFSTTLSPSELEELENLETHAELKVIHLNEKDWSKFSETFAYDANAIEGSTLTASEVVGILKNKKRRVRLKRRLQKSKT